MSNIAEGFARETDKEFLRGLWISKGSVAEVQSLSYAAIDQGYLTEDVRKRIYDQAERVAELESGMIKYLRKSVNQPRKLGI
jgi:four helix bundle protein